MSSEQEVIARPTRWDQSGRTVVVTGAASGIGEATARGFALAGAMVIVADANGDGATAVAASIGAAGGYASAFRVDVRDIAQVTAMVDHAENTFGPVEVLVSNAGVGVAAPVSETSEADLDRVLAVNVKGVFYGAKVVIPRMLERGGGIIVNTASAVAIAAVPNRAAYVASKGAVVSLTRSIALDYMRQGIRCNCVAPGVIDSPWVGSILAGSDDPAEARTRMIDRQPIGRMGRPEEIAAAILFLASDEAAFVHGTCLIVDGGFSVP